MIDRTQLESFLQANGIKPTANDEEIRSVLVSAKWGEDDVSTAMSVLSENKVSYETHIDTFRKVFRTDEALTPQEISYLLGIDVNVSSNQITKQNRRKNTPLCVSPAIILIGAAIAAFAAIGHIMYSQKIGPFYEAPNQTNLTRQQTN